MNNSPQYLLLLCFFLINQCLFAQENPLVSDRPGQTRSSKVLQKGGVQLETGLLWVRDNDTQILDKGLSWDALFRVGLFENMELRLLTNYQTFTTNFSTTRVSGWSPITVGTKIAIRKEDGWLPEMAFLGNLTLPYVGDRLFRPLDIEPSFRMCFTHSISARVSLGYNLGLEWERAEEAGIYTVVLGFGITDRLSGFVEQFGTIAGDFNVFASMNGGLAYLITDDFQMDLTAGVGVSQFADDAFVNFGFSWRIPKRNQTMK